jgi:hypothetical protein
MSYNIGQKEVDLIHEFYRKELNLNSTKENTFIPKKKKNVKRNNKKT